MENVDLIASCWTTAGTAAPGRRDETSPHSLGDRITAASRAGFRGFGLVYADLIVARDHYGYNEMRRMFEDAGLVHLELEFLLDWWTDGPRRSVSDAIRDELLRATEALGARHVKAGPDFSDQPWELEQWAGEFGKLAADFDGVGARVSLEFLPMFNVRTLDDALRIVQAAGHPAGGVLIDIWHVARSGTPLSEVAAVPRHLMAGFELNDAHATPVGSLWEDTIDSRQLCGQGAFDVPGFINAARGAGWDGPWGVEILSENYRRRPLNEAIADAYETALAQFALVDASSSPAAHCSGQ